MSLSPPLEAIIQNIIFPHTFKNPKLNGLKNISRKTTPKMLSDNFAAIKNFPHSRLKYSSLPTRF